MLYPRSPLTTPRRVRFGRFELDLATGELRRDGAGRHLPPQPMKVLCLLVERAGRLVTREELREHLWPDTVVEFDHGLNTCIRQIREALGETADAPVCVHTIPRRGYRFAAPLAARSPTRWLRRAPGLGVAAALCLLVALQVEGGPGAREPHPDARAAFLKGRYLVANHRPAEARGHLQAAVRRDPDYALAHAVLARARLWDGDTAGAARSARRAIELEPMLPEAHQALGDLSAHARRDWTTALREYETAIALGPANAELRQANAHILSLLGRHDEAIAEARLALSLDPVSPLVQGDAAYLYFYARRYGEAIRQARAAIDLAPELAAAWYCLVMALEANGDLAGARTVAAGVAQRYGAGPEVVADIRTASPAQGIDRFWRWDLEQMEANGLENRYPLDFAAAYARFREPDLALAFIEGGIEAGAPVVPVIAVDPRFDRIRSDPRFADALARLNLAPSTLGS